MTTTAAIMENNTIRFSDHTLGKFLYMIYVKVLIYRFGEICVSLIHYWKSLSCLKISQLNFLGVSVFVRKVDC